MAEKTLPPRSEIAEEYTWNAPSVFGSVDDWEAEFKQISDIVPEIAARFAGKLSSGPRVLADFLDATEELDRRIGKVYVYASMFSAVDSSDQAATARAGRAMSLYGRIRAALAFDEPEIIALGRERITGWMDSEPRLKLYAHYFDNLFRKAAHVRSAEVEEVIGMLADPFASLSRTASMLANADLKFAPATDGAGDAVSVEQGSVMPNMTSADRELRRTTYENYMGGYVSFKNTFASNLDVAIKRDVLLARVRRHNSSLEASLHANHVPVDVFHNLIEVFKQNLPTWHRYWDIRRRWLGVDELQVYDTWAPLADTQPHVPFAQAVDWISAGMAPLGDEYVAALRQGCLQDRWVDIYPNQGKRQGAFSSGWKGTLPFIMMSYDNALTGMSTLAHELGHSMHSYLTWQHQPTVYSDYSLFVAEVASNFNQAMTRAYLIEHKGDDPQFMIALIEEAMYNFHRYFFQMPLLARFELETHERVERGEGLTADAMINLMADMLEEAYGSAMTVNRNLAGMMWATFQHLYANFYVFQYATGISAAHALANRILNGTPGATGDYLSFLKAGGSLYPLDALKLAGVDMASPEPVETAFGVLAGYVNRLEELLAGR